MKLILIGLACLLSGALALAADGSSYSLDLDIAPTNQSGGYLCKAEIKDLDTGKVLSAPSITLLAGSPATTRTTDGDLVAELRVSVDSKGSRATAELKVSRAGRAVAAQKTTVSIR